MRRNDARENRNERAGWSTDLHETSAKRRNQKSCDDCRPQTLRRRDAARDAEADGKRQRNDADRHARREIGEKRRAIVAAQCGEYFRTWQWHQKCSVKDSNPRK